MDRILDITTVDGWKAVVLSKDRQYPQRQLQATRGV